MEGLTILFLFFRFLEGELQNKGTCLRKIKLNIIALETDFKRLKQMEVLKLTLGDCLYPIDLDKLKIENQQLFLLLRYKTKELRKLKEHMGKELSKFFN